MRELFIFAGAVLIFLGIMPEKSARSSETEKKPAPGAPDPAGAAAQPILTDITNDGTNGADSAKPVPTGETPTPPEQSS